LREVAVCHGHDPLLNTRLADLAGARKLVKTAVDNSTFLPRIGGETHTERRQPAVGKRISKEGIPEVFDFLFAGEPVRTCKTIWRDDTQVGVMFVQR
jgi:hypothetical protein